MKISRYRGDTEFNLEEDGLQVVVEGQNDGRNLLFGMALCDIFPERAFIHPFNNTYWHQSETETADGVEIFEREDARCTEDSVHINAEFVPCFFLAPTLIYVVGATEK